MARYRDSKTGKFVSKKTWERSHSHGGKRYKRERPARLPQPAPARKLPRPRPEEIDFGEEDFIDDETAEYGGAFDSPKKGKK